MELVEEEAVAHLLHLQTAAGPSQSAAPSHLTSFKLDIKAASRSV